MITTDNYKPKHAKSLKKRVIEMFESIMPEEYEPKHPRVPQQEELFYNYEGIERRAVLDYNDEGDLCTTEDSEVFD